MSQISVATEYAHVSLENPGNSKTFLQAEYEEPKEEEVYLSGPRLWIMVFSLVVSIFLISLDLVRKIFVLLNAVLIL